MVIGPEQGQELMLSKIFKLKLAGLVKLAVGGLYLNKPDLSAIPLNIPTFIYHFLMRLKWTNTNQGFRDLSSNLPL